MAGMFDDLPKTGSAPPKKTSMFDDLPKTGSAPPKEGVIPSTLGKIAAWSDTKDSSGKDLATKVSEGRFLSEGGLTDVAKGVVGGW